MPDPLRRIWKIVESAMDCPPRMRAAMLDEACGDDDALRAEVEGLLAHESGSSSFLEPPVRGAVDEMVAYTKATDAVGRRIGAYRITDVIATGGMGTVYRAVRADHQYEKEVAVKLVKRGMATDYLLERFHQERQTLANLVHPNITRLLDGGTTEDGLPYFVMDYIEGQPIDRYCDEHRLSLNERLALFCKVCFAIHYAHQNLTVHRDLKPSNILVTRDGEPKLLDFGIAKLLEEDPENRDQEVTMTALRIMTPQYSSPEQIRGEPITTASDVYSLGVVLYELLTGHRPYKLNNLPRYEAERIVCEVEPATPSTVIKLIEEFDRPNGTAATVTPESVSELRGELPAKLRRRLAGDLDNIILMAMRKDPPRRYTSAGQLAEDIRRHLDGLPVIAGKDTLTYRTAKFVRRNKAGVFAASAVAFALIVGIVGTSAGLMRAKRAQSDAQDVVYFLQETLAAANPYLKAGDATVLDLLQGATERIETELGGQPIVEAQVRYTIGQTYAAMWRWDAAVQHLRIALDLFRKHRGDQHPDVAKTLSILGRGLTFAHDPESVSAQREALAIRRKHFGEHHPLVAESNGNLGYALWHGVKPPQWEEADRLYRESIALYRTLDGDNQRDLARFTFSFGVMNSRRKRYQESEKHFRDALDIYRSSYGTAGSDDRYMVECLVQYASLLQALGRSDESVALLREALDLIPDDLAGMLTQNVHWNLGVALYENQEWSAAESVIQTCLQRHIELFPDDQLQLANKRIALGACLTQLGRFEEAEAQLSQGYAVIASKCCQSADSTLKAARHLAHLYDAWGKPDRATDYLAMLPAHEPDED